jgi:uncharacterized protein
MNRRTKLMIAAGLGLAIVASGTAYAYAAQGDAAAELRASGLVGEQADGYLGLVGSGSADVRARVDAINIQRRAYYTDLASSARGSTRSTSSAGLIIPISPRAGERRSRRSRRPPPASFSGPRSARINITA